MTIAKPHVNTWTQLSLLPPGETTIVLKVMLDPANNKADWAIVVNDSLTNNLLGMRVWPMRSTDAWVADYEAIARDLAEIVGSLVDPF